MPSSVPVFSAIARKFRLLTIAVVLCIVYLYEDISYFGGWSFDQRRSSIIYDKLQDDPTAAETRHVGDLIANRKNVTHKSLSAVFFAVQSGPKRNATAITRDHDTAAGNHHVGDLIAKSKNITQKSSLVDKKAAIQSGPKGNAADIAIAWDHDSWYGDIAGRNNPAGPDGLNVTISMNRHRIDRLGGNVKRPFLMYAYAKCKGYKFCIVMGEEGVSKSLNFPYCPDNLQDFSPPKGRFFDHGKDNPINESGTYTYGGSHNGPDDYAVEKAVHELDGKCAFSDDFRQLWRDMILQAPKDPSLNITMAQQDLFSDNNRTMTIAVNIRRGDVLSARRAIWDEIYVKLLEQLRPAVKRIGKTPEVHLFSEDYGMIDYGRNISINWSLYEGLVDHFHLAPNMQSKGSVGRHNMDVSLNIRDWRHFVKADILVVGGTFSEIPAYGRPSMPDQETGSGLTLYPCPNSKKCSIFNKTFYVHGWSKENGGRMDQLELLNMPQILAAPNDSKLSKSTAVMDGATATAGSQTFATPNRETPVRQNVSLVTSFFADGILTLMNDDTAKATTLDHLHEISAAILNNIHNPHFAQVVVILDGARDEANCSHFRDYLEKLDSSFLEWNRQHANITILDTDASLQKLSCVNREQGQPNYFEMFQYATNFNATESPIVTSPIVILENADQVFDETLYWAGLIKPNTILTLPTHGYKIQKSPSPEVTAYFQFATRTLSKPLNWDRLKVEGWCKRSLSWDGCIFHQNYVRGTLVDPRVFQRPTKQNSTAFFKMNEIAAEHAALWALLQNTPNGTQTMKGCSVIKTWHYHAAPKMHTHIKSRGFGWADKRDSVPAPWAFAPPLSKAEEVFLVDPKMTQSIS